MRANFQNPKNAFRRATEFYKLGKHQVALDILYEVIKNKRYRQFNNEDHPNIMELYIILCIELRKSHLAKEGLYQYKIICQQVNVKALEDVILFYLNRAERLTEEAKAKSHQAVLDVDDLDQMTSQETQLMSAVSGEDSQDRSDRLILVPWVKFLWESYRECLDLLRNNSSVEQLYNEIASKAFKFCHVYNRKAELRKLCNSLRNHLENVTKYQNVQNAIDLNNASSQELFLDARLNLLDHAILMELWQVAFNAIEDIHKLMQMSTKPTSPKHMATYYSKIALVLFKSGSLLFHACTLQRLFNLSREMRKNVTQEEMQKMAARVLLATLSVPLVSQRSEFLQFLDTALAVNQKHMILSMEDKHRSLANLLNCPSVGSRKSLMDDLEKFGIIQYCSSELQQLYRWLHLEFHPLTLCTKVETSLDYIRSLDQEDLVMYIEPLKSVTLGKFLNQIVEVYQTLSFSRMAKLASFATHVQLERKIVESSRNGEVQIRIDHKNNCYQFAKELSISQQTEAELHGDRYKLQPMPSDMLKNQLVNMTVALNKATAAIKAIEPDKERTEERDALIRTYLKVYKQQHKEILQRKVLIEKRKEHLETVNEQKEKQENDLKLARQAEQQKREKFRRETEMEQQEKEKLQMERTKIKDQQAKDKLEALKKTPLGKKAFENVNAEELKEMDPDEIVAKQLEQLDKEKRELNEKLKYQEKRLDYAERAKRLVEIPLLKKDYISIKSNNKKRWEEFEKDRVEIAIREHNLGIQNKARLLRIMDERDEFLAKLQASSKERHKNELLAWEERRKVKREERLTLRKLERVKQRREKWRKDQEDERQRLSDEKLKREKDEEERECLEREKIAQDLEKAKLDKLAEQTARQKAKEREIEEKLRQDESAKRNVYPDSHRAKDDESSRGGMQQEPQDQSRGNWRDDGWRSDRRDDRPREMTRDFRDERSRDMTRDFRDERSRDMTRDFRDERPSEMTRDFRDERPREMTRDFRDERPREMTRDFRDDRPREIVRDFRDDRPREMTRDFRDDRQNDGFRNFRDDRPQRESYRDYRDDRYREPQRDFGRVSGPDNWRKTPPSRDWGGQDDAGRYPPSRSSDGWRSRDDKEGASQNRDWGRRDDKSRLNDRPMYRDDDKRSDNPKGNSPLGDRVSHEKSQATQGGQDCDGWTKVQR